MMTVPVGAAELRPGDVIRRRVLGAGTGVWRYYDVVSEVVDVKRDGAIYSITFAGETVPHRCSGAAVFRKVEA